jgi:hypothetical protein
MSTFAKSLHTLAVLALLAASAPALTISQECDINGTYTDIGPRYQDWYFNAQGLDSGIYAQWSAARWDLTDMKAQFDDAYGPGLWTIDAVTLELTQNNAAWTTDGAFEIYFCPDDVTDIGTTGFCFYPFMGGLTGSPTFVTSEYFVEIASGYVDIFNVGAPVVTNDILTDNILTLAVVDYDPWVAATWAGNTSFDYQGPTLNVTATPEPATLALLALGAAAITITRKR